MAVLVCGAPMAVREWLGLTAGRAGVVSMVTLEWLGLGLMPVAACGAPMAVLEWLGLMAVLEWKPRAIFLRRRAALPTPAAGWVDRVMAIAALAWVDRVMAMAVPGWVDQDQLMAMAVPGWPVPVTAARAWVISTMAVPA